MENGTTVAFVTSNAGKFATARAHLEPFDLRLEQVELELDEIQAAAVADVAVHKAWQAFRELRRPVIVEDSGFYIDELGDFPGPLIKHVLRALGPAGVARLADQTTQRRCHFESVLAFVDADGQLHTFTDHGDGGTVAMQPAAAREPGAWSALWDVFIPTGRSTALSALPELERNAVFEGWAKESVFVAFGGWLSERRATSSLARRGDVLPDALELRR